MARRFKDLIGQAQLHHSPKVHHRDLTCEVTHLHAAHQVVSAFAQVCREHAAEGGTEARLERYRRNWRRLMDGMRQMGFVTVVPDGFASPIVATFREPEHPNFSFPALFQGMKRRGFIIFPGRLALANTVRIGCMGDVTEADIVEAMDALAATMAEMGITALGRAAAVAAG